MIMPNGFGTYGPGAETAQSALDGVRIPLEGGAGLGTAGLGTAALAAVERLAAASGHPVPVPPPPATTARAHSSDPISVIVFVLGGVLIAAAWAASLRARPPRIRRRSPAGP